MKYLLFILLNLSFNAANAQNKCDLFRNILTMFGTKYKHFVVIDEVRVEKYDALPKFRALNQLPLDSSGLKELWNNAQSGRMQDSVVLLSSCFIHVAIVKSNEAFNILNRNAEIRDNTDTAVGRAIDREMNRLLSIAIKRERYERYNRYMKTAEVVNYRKKIADSSTVVIKITQPIMSSNFAMVDIIPTVYVPGRNESSGYAALFAWRGGRWEFIARD